MPAGALEQLDAMVVQACVGGTFTAVSARVASRSAVVWSATAPAGPGGGRRAAAIKPSTCFDLASLTKPYVATLALALDRRGALPLALPIGETFPGAAPRLARRTLEDLLRHRAGLQPWMPLYRRCRDGAGALRLLLTETVLGAPPGTYSDLGFILWGFAAERTLGQPLRELLLREVLRPLHIEARVGAVPGAARDVAPCRLDRQRERELAAQLGIAVARGKAPARGEVQDGNARFLGGLAGHAGLFAPVDGVLALAREWLRPEVLLTRRQVERALAGTGPYALGWARRRVRGSAGPALAPSSFGHAGFTGGSEWIDPERERIFVWLGHRRSASSDLNAWRRRFHALAARL